MATDFKKAAAKGMAWTGLERVVLHALRFVVGLAMARLLLPADYGIVGMLAIFFAIADTFQDCGFTSALIQKKDRTESDYATVFWFGLAVSLAIFVVFYVVAPWIAEFYRMPILTPITRASAFNFVIGALGAVQRTRLTIQLRFGVQAALSIAGFLISSAIGLTLAFKGFGPWALVWQGVLGGALNTIVLWIVVRWWPKLDFSGDSFRRLFGFGWKLLCSSMINNIYGNIYTLVIGKAFGAAEIGHFNRASGFADLPSGTLQGIVLKVNYPILAELQDDTPRLLSAYRRLLHAPLFLLVPISLGMAVVADPMVRVFIGEKWLSCVPYLQILCFGAIWGPLTHINLNLLYVKGRTDLVLKLELVKKPIAFLILFSMIPFGIVWMCVGNAVYSFIAFCFNCYYTKKILGYGFAAQMKDLLPMFLNGALMMVMTWFAMLPWDAPFAKLVCGMVVGSAWYLGVAALCKDEVLLMGLEMARARFSPREKP